MSCEVDWSFISRNGSTISLDNEIYSGFTFIDDIYIACLRLFLKRLCGRHLVEIELCQFKPLSIHEKFCNLHAMLLIMAAQVPQSPAIIQVCIKLSSHSNPYILTQQSFKVCWPKPFVAVLLTPNPTSHQFPCVRRISLFVTSVLF